MAKKISAVDKADISFPVRKIETVYLEIIPYPDIIHSITHSLSALYFSVIILFLN